MEELIKMARDLGVAIQKSDVYTNIQTATKANDEDEALQNQIDEFNSTRTELSTLMQSPDKDEAQLQELDSKLKGLYEDVMANENMAKFNASKDQVDSLMNAIQNILTGAVNGEDPQTIEPFPEEAGCGSGGCSGCGGGCH